MQQKEEYGIRVNVTHLKSHQCNYSHKSSQKFLTHSHESLCTKRAITVNFVLMPLPHSVMGWPLICGFGISWSYLLGFQDNYTLLYKLLDLHHCNTPCGCGHTIVSPETQSIERDPMV